MFDQILDLVGQPPGSLVYHFIVLFAVEAAFAISIGQWMRERDSGTARVAVAAFAILFARTLILIASLAAWRGHLPRNVVVPPLERAVDTITVLGLAWTFITMDDPSILRRNFMPDLVAAVALGMMLAGFAGTYYYWFFAVSSGQLFNGLWLDVAWSITQIVLAIMGLIWMLARVKYAYDPFLKGIMLIILGGAAGIHLVQPVLGDVAAAMRIGQVMVMPMLAAVAYRHVVEQLLHWDEFEPSRPSERMLDVAVAPLPVPAEPSQLPPMPSPSPTPPPPSSQEETRRAIEPPPEKRKASGQPALLDVVEAMGGLLSTLEPAEVAREASRAVATALRADICVLAVVDEVSQQAGIVGGYDNIAQSYLPQTVLDLADHPTIVNALGRLRQMRLTTQRNSRELRDLYRKLLISHIGPAYLQPLVRQEERIGVLIVGSPYSERQLSNDERNLFDRLAPLVTASLLNAETHQDEKELSEKVALEEGARLANLSDNLTATTADLNSAQRQIDEMKDYIRDLHRQLKGMPEQQAVAHEQIESLQSEIERLQAIDVEAERLREQYEELEQRHKQLVAKNEELKQAEDGSTRQESAHLPQQTQGVALGTPADQYLIQHQLEEARLAAQSEIASLRVRLAQASISQQEVAFLQDQLAAKAREAIGLHARLTEAQAVTEALREQISSGAGGRNLEAIQARVAAQATEIASLRAQLAEARASAELSPEALRAQEEMDQIDREAVTQLEAQLAERAALVEALEAQLSDKAQAIVQLKLHMSEVEKSLQNLEKQLSHKTEEVVTLQASMAETRTQAQERIAALHAEIESGVRDAGDIDQARVQALEAELAEKAAAIEVMETQLQSTKQSMSRLEQQLSATNQAVDAAISEARQIDSHDEVIASIAQELRTPMSSIMGYTELLMGESVGILGSLQRKFLQRVKANTERMGILLDDLIRMTALDTGLQLEPQKVDVIYAIEEAITNLANQYREKGITLRMALPDKIPPLTADHDALLQVLGHLLSNAALASPVDGEVQLLVTTCDDHVPAHVDTEVETPCLYISVEDSGVGIDPEDFERVFMRKYRADNPLIEGLGDTGVSLSLAKTLIDAHGGRIWLESQKRVGTTFHVLLPFEPRRGTEGSKS